MELITVTKFKYSAFDDKGKLNKGTVEADSYQLAMEELRTRNLWIVKLFDPGQSIFRRDLNFGGPKVRTEHFTIFCRQLSTMYQSGVGMMDAVRILSAQTDSKVFKKVLVEVSDEMKRGSQFSTA